MDLAERKARILYGQHLTNLADQKLVCRDLNGIQAQFLSAALHALDIRTAGPVESDKLVKSWTIRGTVHLFDPADLPLFLHESPNEADSAPVQKITLSFATLRHSQCWWHRYP